MRGHRGCGPLHRAQGTYPVNNKARAFFLLALFALIGVLILWLSAADGSTRRQGRREGGARRSTVVSATVLADGGDAGFADATADGGDAEFPDALPDGGDAAADGGDAAADGGDAAADGGDAAPTDSGWEGLTALTLNTTDERFTVVDNAVWDATPTTFSWCFRVKETIWTTTDYIAAKIATNQRSWAIRSHNSNANRVQVFISNGLTDSANHCVTVADVLTNAAYTGLCVIYNGPAADADEITIYTDAVARTESCTGDIPDTRTDSTSNISFGADNSGAGPMAGGSGFIDSISFWNVALTQSNVTAIYNSGCPVDVRTLGISGLVAYWPILSADSVTNIDDPVGGFDGTPVNIDAADFITLPSCP